MFDSSKVRSVLKVALGVLFDIIEDDNVSAEEVEQRLANLAETARVWRLLAEVTREPKRPTKR